MHGIRTKTSRTREILAVAHARADHYWPGIWHDRIVIRHSWVESIRLGLDQSANVGWAWINYVALFQNENYIEAFVNTLKFSALYVPGVVIISLLLAVLLNRKIRGVGFFAQFIFFQR